MNTHGWEAHIIDWDPIAYGADQQRIWIRRKIGDREAELLTSVNQDRGELLRYDLDALTVATDGEPFRGLLLPLGVAASIADAVNPGPGRAELARLEAALTLEQSRVDRILGSLLS